MKLLLDTHLLLWAAGMPERLPDRARTLIERSDAEPMVSAASLWEVAIKAGLRRERHVARRVNPLRGSSASLRPFG